MTRAERTDRMRVRSDALELAAALVLSGEVLSWTNPGDIVLHSCNQSKEDLPVFYRVRLDKRTRFF